jgi:hypothetical protein
MNISLLKKRVAGWPIVRQNSVAKRLPISVVSQKPRIWKMGLNRFVEWKEITLKRKNRKRWKLTNFANFLQWEMIWTTKAIHANAKPIDFALTTAGQK